LRRDLNGFTAKACERELKRLADAFFAHEAAQDADFAALREASTASAQRLHDAKAAWQKSSRRHGRQGSTSMASATTTTSADATAASTADSNVSSTADSDVSPRDRGGPEEPTPAQLAHVAVDDRKAAAIERLRQARDRLPAPPIDALAAAHAKQVGL
jgi:hypothetical protein